MSFIMLDTHSSINTTYVVVCSVASFLVVVLLTILVKLIYKNRKRAKYNTNEQVQIPTSNPDDANYMEANEHVRGSFFGLNADTVATYEIPLHTYEVSPALIYEEF